jgi:NAD+ synthase (glutamine-hydrolysing)
LVTITASPFHAGKREFRQRMLSIRASDNAAFLCYLNPVGGQDELVFDGGSMILDPQGDLLAHCRQFEEDLLIRDLILDQVWQARLHDPRRRKDRQAARRRPHIEIPMPAALETADPAEIPERRVATCWRRCTRPGPGARDYVRKNGFQRSDSLGRSRPVATLAVDALGPGMSLASDISRYSSEGSRPTRFNCQNWASAAVHPDQGCYTLC